MPYKDVEETEHSLTRVRRVCTLITVALKVILVVTCIYWVISTLLMCYSLVNPGSFSFLGATSVLNILLFILYDVAIGSMFVVFIRIFSSASRGESPFTLDQVKRLRTIAVLLLLCAVLDFGITVDGSLFQYGGVNIGYISTSDTMIFPINFGLLISAAVVFAFSFVFKYGVLLQELSDDTL